MPSWVTGLIGLVFSKKKVMTWVAAGVIAVLVAVFGFSVDEIKSAVADAPTLELPTAKAPVAAPPAIASPTPAPKK